MNVRVDSADDIDLDEVVNDLARLRRPWLTGRLAWRMSPPTGAGVVVRVDGGVALAIPVEVAGQGTRRRMWQLVEAAGGRVDVALDALRDHVGDAPVLAIGDRRPEGRWTRVERLRTWVTGPDPFVDVQSEVDGFGPRHTRLAMALEVRPELSVARDAAWLTWRYREEPGVEHVVMEVPGESGCDGFIVMRATPVRGQRAVVIEDLQAVDTDTHYALLKAARRWSWDLGSLPVVLRGESMSRLYAFTAGYLPASAPLVRRSWQVWVRGPEPGGPWRGWKSDAVPR